MPILKSTKKEEKATEPASATPAEEEKTRPGTSGTEVLLVSTRREAAQKFQKAQRAETTYRSKKRATAARRDFKEAKGHFKDSARSFKLGAKMLFGSVKSIPYIMGQKKDERRRARAAASKKKLEEQLAKQNEDADPTTTTDAKANEA